MEKQSGIHQEEGFVRVGTGRVELEGNLLLPLGTRAVVLFAHGSGSSRHSPRNRYVSRVLQRAGLGTLLIDLLTAREEEIDMSTMHLRFDIGLLAERLTGVTEWLRREEHTRMLGLGYFGASTGAAAALVAAAGLGEAIGAVVSRGGRPDLAGPYLPRVASPTLLIVGQIDPQVLMLNREALDSLGARRKKMVVVSGATHLFEEPGTLEQAAEHASEWFSEHLLGQTPERFEA